MCFPCAVRSMFGSFIFQEVYIRRLVVSLLIATSFTTPAAHDTLASHHPERIRGLIALDSFCSRSLQPRSTLHGFSLSSELAVMKEFLSGCTRVSFGTC